MLATISQYYFEIAGVSVVVFLVTCVILGFSISQEQVEEKQNTGHTEYSTSQNVLIYTGVTAFWVLLVVSLTTVIMEFMEMMSANNFGM